MARELIAVTEPNKALQRPIYKAVEDYADRRYFVVPVSVIDATATVDGDTATVDGEKVYTFDFSEVLTSNRTSARRSNDGKYAILKYRTDPRAVDFADKPKSLTTTAMTIEQVRTETAKANWTAEAE
jgi:hypothetical protein